jgi:HK97 family phage prohead protease
MANELITRANPFTATALKAFDLKKRFVSGYYSSWDTKDSYGDRMRRGATLKSIGENGPTSNLPRIKHFQNHDIYLPLSKLSLLGEDDFGAFYEGTVGTHELGNQFLEMCDSGLITEHSFGLSYVKTNVLEDGSTELLEVKVWEVSSLTAWGANPFTPFKDEKKSASTLEQVQYWTNKMSLVEKFIHNTKTVDETTHADLVQSLTIFLKEAMQHIIDLTNTTLAAEKAQEPETTDDSEDYTGLLSSIQSFKSTFKTNI